MKNWIANKIEDWLEAKGWYDLTGKWFNFACSRQWYQPKYSY